jgi:hypothetical protein
LLKAGTKSGGGALRARAAPPPGRGGGGGGAGRPPPPPPPPDGVARAAAVDERADVLVHRDELDRVLARAEAERDGALANLGHEVGEGAAEVGGADVVSLEGEEPPVGFEREGGPHAHHARPGRRERDLWVVRGRVVEPLAGVRGVGRVVELEGDRGERRERVERVRVAREGRLERAARLDPLLAVDEVGDLLERLDEVGRGSAASAPAPLLRHASQDTQKGPANRGRFGSLALRRWARGGARG